MCSSLHHRARVAHELRILYLRTVLYGLNFRNLSDAYSEFGPSARHSFVTSSNPEALRAHRKKILKDCEAFAEMDTSKQYAVF